MLEVMIWHTESEAMLGGFSLSVAGAPLPFRGRRWRGPAVGLDGTSPAEIVRAQRGEVEVALPYSRIGGVGPLGFCGLGRRTADPTAEAGP